MNGVLRSLDAQWGWAGPELLRGQLVQGSCPYTSQVKQIPQMLSKHLQGLATMFLSSKMDKIRFLSSGCSNFYRGVDTCLVKDTSYNVVPGIKRNRQIYRRTQGRHGL